jgi:HTH-type transcriptional regulator/antitoxin HigA
MKPRIIRTEKDYEVALKHMESLKDAAPDSAEEEDLELWSLLVDRYEQEHFPIENPDPVEAIKFRMDQLGLKQKDLTQFIPNKSKVSEVLNHKRPLSLSMIRALHQNLGIPAEVLVRESPPGDWGKGR